MSDECLSNIKKSKAVSITVYILYMNRRQSINSTLSTMAAYVISELAAALETMRHDFHFPGHLLPGTAFITMGVWWIWGAFKIYNENEQRTDSENLLNHEKCSDQDSSSFPATHNGHGMGLSSCEGFYKIVYATFDLFSHFLVVLYGGDMTDEWQHMTVYFFFILNGIIDIIFHKKLHKMPDGSDYAASSISWAAFGFLFLSHKHAKTEISIFYHQILGRLAVAVAVITLMQCKYNRNTLIALTRGSCCTLAGFWLYQIAFLFHNPFVAANQYRNLRQNGADGAPIDEMKGSGSDTIATMMEQTEIMNAVTIFTWLVILVGCLVVFLGVVSSRREHVYYRRIRHCCV